MCFEAETANSQQQCKQWKGRVYEMKIADCTTGPDWRWYRNQRNWINLSSKCDRCPCQILIWQLVVPGLIAPCQGCIRGFEHVFIQYSLHMLMMFPFKSLAYCDQSNVTSAHVNYSRVDNSLVWSVWQKDV